jgi:predicted transcriptional regulator
MISVMPQPLPNLSRAEYGILRILWKQGRQSVREVHDQLKSSHHWAYTTTKTMMDRMVSKKLLKRDSFHGIFLYTPLISRPAGLARFVHFFAERVLETDPGNVVSLFSKSGTISRDELDELERLLDQLDKDD